MFCQMAGLDSKSKSTVIPLLSHCRAGDILTQWLPLTASILHPWADQMGRIWKKDGTGAWGWGTGQYLALWGTPEVGYKYSSAWNRARWQEGGTLGSQMNRLDYGREKKAWTECPIQGHVKGWHQTSPSLPHKDAAYQLDWLYQLLQCVHAPSLTQFPIPSKEVDTTGCCEMRTAHLFLSRTGAFEDQEPCEKDMAASSMRLPLAKLWQSQQRQ